MSRLKVFGRRGFWWHGPRWNVCYWPPGSWLPFSVREGLEGSKGCWGALRITRRAS